MSDKPKRKRSEKAKPLWRLRLLVLLYVVFLIPYFFDSLSSLYFLIVHSFILGVLLVGWSFMKVLRSLKENFLTSLIISIIGGAAITLAGLLFIASAWFGIVLWVDFLSRYFSFSVTNMWGFIIVMIVSSVICVLIPLELYIQITEFMDPIPDYVIKTERQKNAAENADSEIPFEVLAQSESARYKMK